MSRFHQAPKGAPRAFLEAIPENGDGCLTWPFGKNGCGYAMINGMPNSRLVSRLVCEKTHGPAPTKAHHAAHSCGRGHEGCVAPWHLSWKTPRENHADQYLHGTRVMGDRHPMSKLDEATVRQIRNRFEQGEKQAQLSKAFGITPSKVSAIVRGVAWASVR